MQRGEMLGPRRQTLAPPDVWVEAPPRCRAPAALEGSRGMLMACGSRQLWAGAILPTLGNPNPTQTPSPTVTLFPRPPRLGHVVTLLDAEHAVVQRVLLERDAVADAPEAQGLGL